MNNQNFAKKMAISVVISSIFSSAAMATTSTSVAGGTITFSGAVTDTTCNVTTNNGGDFTVSMSPISSDDVGTTAGVVTTGATSFTMAVSGCEGYTATSTSAQALQISFTGSNVSDDETYLTNSTGTATGIGIAITSDGSTPVSLNTMLDTGLATTSSDSSATTPVYDTGAIGNVTYYANYYNYGGSSVSTGSVISDVTYTFNYE